MNAVDDRRTIRIAGVLGLSGALLMLLGDVLLYAHGTDGIRVDPALRAMLGVRVAVLGAPPAQLMVSGVIGPVAACLYLCGFWHVHAQLGRRPWAAFVTIGLSVMIVIGGAYHALWSHYGFILQFAASGAAAAAGLVEDATRYMRLMYSAGAVAGYSAALVLLVLVLRGRTRYPRWTALANPGLLIALAPLFRPLAAHLPEPAGALLLGCWINAAFVVFFLVSLAATRGETRLQDGGMSRPRT